MRLKLGSFYKKQLNDWKATLEVKADIVFDIGGAQDPIKGMTKSWDVKDYKIIDLPVPHVEKVHPDIEWDMNEPMVSETSPVGDIPMPMADLIFMLGVMDYVIEPGIAMRNIHYLLKEDGIAWVEFPYFYCTHNPVEEEGCRYSEGCINRLAKQANLEITERIYKYPKPGNDHLIQFFIEDGMRMARGVDHRITGFIFKFRKA